MGFDFFTSPASILCAVQRDGLEDKGDNAQWLVLRVCFVRLPSSSARAPRPGLHASCGPGRAGVTGASSPLHAEFNPSNIHPTLRTKSDAEEWGCRGHLLAANRARHLMTSRANKGPRWGAAAIIIPNLITTQRKRPTQLRVSEEGDINRCGGLG